MRSLIIIAAMVLAGCSTCKPQIVERVVTVEVKVPVATPIPEPKAVSRPQLMIFELTSADEEEPGKVIKYYRASIKQLQGYVVELETILDGYRNNGATMKKPLPPPATK